MGFPAKPVRERLFEKVDQRGPDECWPWSQSLDTKGYGRFMLNPGELGAARRTWVAASRAAYLVTHGETVQMPERVDHECHNQDASCKGGSTCAHRACCNPAHLRAVTHRENLIAGRGGRRATCPAGHAMTPDNLTKYDLDRGHWRCRTCANDRARARKEKNR